MMTIMVTRRDHRVPPPPAAKKPPTPTPECPHSDYLTPQTCSICKHGPQRRSYEEPTIVARFTTKFPNTCAECDFSIELGQKASKTSTGVIVHDYCEHEWLTGTNL